MSVFTKEQRRLITANVETAACMFDATRESILEHAFSCGFECVYIDKVMTDYARSETDKAGYKS